MDLAGLFGQVAETLRRHQQELNAADSENGNHGDHMVEIFQAAQQAAGITGGETGRIMAGGSLAEAMDAAGRRLESLTGNGSARVYAQGLNQLASQFRRYEIDLDELVAYIQAVLSEQKAPNDDPSVETTKPRSGDVLKAFVSGLAGWQAAAHGNASPSGRTLELGSLFDLGVAYMQAKSRNGSRTEVLADAAASASPLAEIPHRYQSGKLAVQAFLEALEAEKPGG